MNKFTDYIITFMTKEKKVDKCYTYQVEAISKAQAIGIAFQIFFAEHYEDKIDDYSVEELINGKYEYI
jgi:hypothetical protein